MAMKRSGGVFWSAATLTVNDASPSVRIGAADKVAIFIKNGDNADATFKVQCSGAGVPSAGKNAAESDWFDYLEEDNSSVLSFVVPAGEARCFDLSPFAPSRIRLVNTAGTTPTNISAFCEANG